MSTSNPIKLGQHAHLRCAIADEPCNCADGTCENAEVRLTTYSKCGMTAAAFICDTQGCPVNGGAAYG